MDCDEKGKEEKKNSLRGRAGLKKRKRWKDVRREHGQLLFVVSVTRRKRKGGEGAAN